MPPRPTAPLPLPNLGYCTLLRDIAGVGVADVGIARAGIADAEVADVGIAVIVVERVGVGRVASMGVGVANKRSSTCLPNLSSPFRLGTRLTIVKMMCDLCDRYVRAELDPACLVNGLCCDARVHVPLYDLARVGTRSLGHVRGWVFEC